MKDSTWKSVATKQSRLTAKEVQSVKVRVVGLSWGIQNKLLTLLTLQHPRVELSEELQKLFVGLEEALDSAVSEEASRT